MALQTILYDIPSQQGTAWSLNPWKTRMVLNYKGIHYKTEWVEYPDLASTYKEFGIPPNSKDAPGYFTDYSAPAIQYTDGTRQQDSWPIVHELEKRYPSPSLHLEDPVVVQIRDQIGEMFDPLRVHFIPKVVRLLSPRSAEYFEETRAKRFGAPLSEVLENAGEDSWKKAEVPIRETGDLLRKHGGPFFLGETVSYADFIFVSLLHMLKRVDEVKFERFMSLDPAFPKLYEASKQWLEKDR